MNGKENLFKPVWSRQHGAYTTLITSWLIGTLLSTHISYLHPIILLFLLSGFNFSEFLQDTQLRNSPMSKRKKFWYYIYMVVMILAGIYLLFYVPALIYILPVLIIVGAVFLLLTKLRKHKNIAAEFLTFAAISISGLTALNPSEKPELSVIFPVWLLMFLYFSSSIFIVKIRFARVDYKEVITYLLVSSIILLTVLSPKPVVWLTIILMLIRLSPLLFIQEWFSKLKIKSIGFTEVGFQVLFIAVIIAALK
jgi:hypothetical protein